MSILTSFSAFALTVDDTAYPTGSICWTVDNMLSWTTSRISDTQASANSLLVWLQGVPRLWLRGCVRRLIRLAPTVEA